jgi:hypothetical protein
MGTTKPSKRILESCDEKAIELINLIKHNSHYDFLDKKYKELLGKLKIDHYYYYYYKKKS